MSLERSFYKTLGVDQKSSFEEIKKAYLQKARLFHPDMQKENSEKSASTFSLISEAYQALSDEKLRNIYDIYGEEGLKIYYNSLTVTQYKTKEKPEKQEKNCPKRKRAPIITTFECDLEDLYLKKTKRVKIKKKVLQEGKLVPQEKILSFTLTPEIGNGTMIKFENEGDEAQGIIPSDIIFTIQLRNHSKFQMINQDLFMYYKLTSQEAQLKQTTVTIYTLDKRTLCFVIPGPVQNGLEYTIKNEGMPTIFGKGNLIVKFIIEFQIN